MSLTWSPRSRSSRAWAVPSPCTIPCACTRCKEPGFSGTAVAGTPVDCVKLALTTLLPQPPDLVVVGINNGANKGVDVFYSGTLARPTEARPAPGCPPVAFSRPRPELEPPQALARHAASLVDARGLALLRPGKS